MAKKVVWDKTKNSTATLEDVKVFLRTNYKDGCVCPACNQDVKMYTRALTSAMAYGLILLTQSGYTDYFHVENYLKQIDCPSSIRGDIAKLKYFKLLEAKEDNREDGSSRNGYYRLPNKAYEFVNNLTTVPEHFLMYNKKAMGFSENHINIEQALGNKFNYKELMTAKSESNTSIDSGF